MNARLSAFGCIVAIVVAPLVAAHLTSLVGSETSRIATGFSGAGDNCRNGGNQATCASWRNAGVSGTYVGAAGLLAGGEVFPRSIPGATLCPPGYCAVANALCDFEVLGSGAPEDPLKILDENWVDQGTSSGGPNGGIVPDGTWDDGGQGGACHVSMYAEEDYNTVGCAGSSHAEDGISGANVWMLVSCDAETSVGVGMVSCVINAAAQGGSNLAQCISGFEDLPCVVEQTCGVGTFASCGADGQADAVNLGQGGGNGGIGVLYPAFGIEPTCSALSAASTLMLNRIEYDGDGNASMIGAIGGWIDWGTDSGAVFTAGPIADELGWIPEWPGWVVEQSDKCPNIGVMGTHTCWVCKMNGQDEDKSITYHDTKEAAEKACKDKGIVYEICVDQVEVMLACDQIAEI